MRPSYRLPLAVLGGAALIAGVLALKPSSNTPGAPAPAQAAPAATDPGALVPYLRFSGYGSVTVRPDTAEIYVSTVSTAASSADALDAASKKMTKVQARLKEYPDPQKAYEQMVSTQLLKRMAKPEEIAAAALCTSVPIAAAGEFSAKYTPGCSAQAATSAVTATKHSSSMPP